MLLYILLVAVVNLVLSEKVLYNGYKVVEITPVNSKQLNTLRHIFKDVNHLEVDLWRPITTVGRPVQIGLSPYLLDQFLQYFRDIGLNPIIRINDVQERIDSQLRHKTGVKNAEEFDYGTYHKLDEVVDWMKNISQVYSSMTKLVEVGKSFEGKTIYGLEIKTSKGTQPKPGFFMEGGIHAREWISPATVIYMTAQLLDKYDSDPNIADMVDKFNWYIIPVFNVDGYEYTFTTDRMWRKTRSKYSGHLCHGVDPNRNWDFHWNEGGTSRDPCSDTYSGPSAFSEIEVKSVADYIQANGKDMKIFIDFHSFSELWMTPWGWTKDLPTDYQEQNAAAKVAVDALKAVHGTSYEHGSIANIIYVASGSSADWTYGKVNITYSYGVELRDKGQHGFLLPDSQIIPSGEETLAAVLALAKYVYDKP